MYEAFYGFRENPFRLTPDPDYLFLSTHHQEALAHLLYGVSEGGGVVVITGEIGTGKTTLLRTLVRNLDAQTAIAYIFNPALSAVELLQAINADLGLPAASTSKKELIDELNSFLLEQRAAGRRVVAIIDEAQNLEPSVLEQLRLLSNLETEREKLLQIVLAGQPELDAVLARPELTQLDQRITLRWHLSPLNASETAAYVRHRLRVTTEGRGGVSFTPHALQAVYRVSHGVPRVINILCHRALLVGYTREERQIDWPIVRQAAKELRHRARVGLSAFPRRAVATSALVVGGICLLVAGAVAGALWRDRLPIAVPLFPAAPVPPSAGESAAAAQPPHGSVPHDAHVSLYRARSTPAPAPAPAPTAVVTVGEYAAPVGSMNEAAPAAEESFLQALRQSTAEESAIRATDGLLRAWGGAALQPQEWQQGLEMTTIAQARGLEHYLLRGPFSRFARLDLPAIVEVFAPPGQGPRFVLLLKMNGDRCRVLVDREYDIPSGVLNEHWLGRGHLFWRDFKQLGPRLSVGSVGDQVQRLHTLLSALRAFTDSETPVAGQETVFSQHTRNAVVRLQQAHDLIPDGVVGPLTMILLYNALPTYTHPRLSDTGEPPPTTEGAKKQEGTAEKTAEMSTSAGGEGS